MRRLVNTWPLCGHASINIALCVQVLFSLPEVAERYVSHAATIFNSTPANPADDLPSQLAKVGVALVQGKTGKPAPLPAAAAAADASGPTASTPAASAAPGSGPEPMDIAEEAAVAAADTAGAPQDAAHAGGGQAETAAQEANSVRPAAFKSLVGKGHPEFSSGRQQVSKACTSCTLFSCYLFCW